MPVIESERVVLRPVSPADYPVLMREELAGPESVLFRHRGVTPSPEQFVSKLWDGVQSQYLICEPFRGIPAGLVLSYHPDYRNQTAHLASIVFASHRRATWPHEGTALFIDHLFDTFPVRKLYAEVLDANYAQFASIPAGLFVEEGRLRNHEWVAGEWADLAILALYRDAWVAHREAPSRGARLSAALRDMVTEGPR